MERARGAAGRFRFMGWSEHPRLEPLKAMPMVHPARFLTIKSEVQHAANEAQTESPAGILVDGPPMKPPANLDSAYQTDHHLVVRRRLCQAGLRLAWVLNEAFVES